MAVTPPPPRRFWDTIGPMRWVRRNLGYSRGEARGLAGLLALMLAVVITPLLLRPQLPVYLRQRDPRAQRERNESPNGLGVGHGAAAGLAEIDKHFKGLALIVLGDVHEHHTERCVFLD